MSKCTHGKHEICAECFNNLPSPADDPDAERVGEAREFVAKMADGTPDEMDLYADIAARFANKVLTEYKQRLAAEFQYQVDLTASFGASNFIRNFAEREFGVTPTPWEERFK